MTEYLILVAVDSDQDASGQKQAAWMPLGRVTARSAQSAIRERINGVAQSSEYYGDGEYVAVPARSWQPVTVKTETKTALKFS